VRQVPASGTYGTEADRRTPVPRPGTGSFAVSVLSPQY
jgi:hypothetical protein